MVNTDLRALAEAASENDPPGSHWEHLRKNSRRNVILVYRDGSATGTAVAATPTIAAYITAADPPTILALLDLVDRQAADLTEACDLLASPPVPTPRSRNGSSAVTLSYSATDAADG